MIHASRLLGRAIDALDGSIGSVHDISFDEQTWKIRYLVVDTGKWLPGRKVLVVPAAIVTPWHEEGAIPLNLSQEQIRSSPEIDPDEPISRQTEELLHSHYAWTRYWDPTIEANDVKLASANEIGGYHVHGTDGDVGHVQDLLIDDDCSRTLFLVVETKGLLFGKTVLAGPSMIDRVDWANSTVHATTTRAALKHAQEYDPAA
jgi:sporulation protein YlmC with PRC-barrel domain